MGQFGSLFFKCVVVCSIFFNCYILAAQNSDPEEFTDVTLEYHENLVIITDTRIRCYGGITLKKQKREVVIEKTVANALKSIKRKERDTILISLLQKQDAYLLYDKGLSMLWDVVNLCSVEQYSSIDNSYYIRKYPQICTKKEGWDIRAKEYVISNHTSITPISTNYFLVVQMNWRTFLQKEGLVTYDDKNIHTSYFIDLKENNPDFPIKVLIPLKPILSD